MNVQSNVMEFDTIKDMADFKAKRDYLFKATGQAGKQFNTFVRATVRYFYHEGNHNVVLINDLLKVAFQSRMANFARLGAYLKQCIPHDYHNDGIKGKCPMFGARKAKVDYNWPEVEEFLKYHLEWNSYGKENKAADFDVKKYLNNVVNMLKQNNVPVAQFCTDLLAKDLEKRAAGASK